MAEEALSITHNWKEEIGSGWILIIPLKVQPLSFLELSPVSHSIASVKGPEPVQISLSFMATNVATLSSFQTRILFRLP